MDKLLKKALNHIKNKSIEKCKIKYSNKKLQLWYRDDNEFEFIYDIYYYNDIILCDMVTAKDTRSIEI